MPKTIELLRMAESRIISDRINEIEVTEKSAKVKQAYNPLLADYRNFLMELAGFLCGHSYINEVEIEHPRLGRIKLTK